MLLIEIMYFRFSEFFTALIPDYISEQKSNWWDAAVSSPINCAEMTVWRSPCWCGESLSFCSGNVIKGPDHCAFCIMPLSLTGLPEAQIKRAAEAVSYLSCGMVLLVILYQLTLMLSADGGCSSVVSVKI